METGTGTEARRERRMRAIKGAKLISPRLAYAAVDCTIVDLTPSGAKLRFAEPIAVDPVFELIVFPENVKVGAKLRWQQGNRAGVEFDRPLDWLDRHQP